jgi:hypothetical protein
MCYELDFRRRLTLDAQTLPVADLLLSKLQIIEMTERDVLDTLAICAICRCNWATTRVSACND